MKVLIGCPVRQDEKIFKYYLESLKRLEGNFDIFFYLHNSKHLSSFLEPGQYEYCESTSLYSPHVWKEDNLSEVAHMKNMLLQKTLKDGYDYFFLVDSDTILHPKTLVHLLSRKKDIVAEVLWTSWKPGLAEMPNAWDQDFYSFRERTPGQVQKGTDKTKKIVELMQTLGIKDQGAIENINRQVMDHLVSVGIRGDGSYQAFRTPGIYKVGGIGGCNLISRKVIEAGVNYNPIPNISWTNWEDRAFCTRAAVHGFDIYLDTCYPAIHLYDEESLKKYESA
jgi:hypothetical protein